MTVDVEWDQREHPVPLSVEAVTDVVANELAARGLFTVRQGQNQLGYIEQERHAVYLITIQHGQFEVNE